MTQELAETTPVPDPNSVSEIAASAPATSPVNRPDPVVQDLCARLVENQRVDHVAVALLGKGASATILAEHPNFNVQGMTMILPATVIEHFKTTRQPYILANIAEAEQLGFDQAALQRQGIRETAFLPLFVDEELIGVAALEVYHALHTFDAQVLLLAMPTADALAQSIYVAENLTALQRKAAQLEIVSSLASRITSTFDRGAIFMLAQEYARKVIDADVVSIALVQPRAIMVELYILAEDGSPTLLEVPIDASGMERPARLALSEAEDDVAQYPKLMDYHTLADAGVHATAFVPLLVVDPNQRSGERSVGTLNVSHKTVGYYAQADLTMLEQIARPIAIALENSRLYSEASRRADIEGMSNRLGSNFQEYTDLNTLLMTTTRYLAEAINARRARVRLNIPDRASESNGNSSTNGSNGNNGTLNKAL
ncbi:MAG: GAF domain-containing protein [Anaerolineae bacterium]